MMLIIKDNSDDPYLKDNIDDSHCKRQLSKRQQ